MKHDSGIAAKLTMKEFLNQNDLRNSILGRYKQRNIPDHAKRQSKVVELNMSHYLLNMISKPMIASTVVKPKGDGDDDDLLLVTANQRKRLLGLYPLREVLSEEERKGISEKVKTFSERYE